MRPGHGANIEGGGNRKSRLRLVVSSRRLPLRAIAAPFPVEIPRQLLPALMLFPVRVARQFSPRVVALQLVGVPSAAAVLELVQPVRRVHLESVLRRVQLRLQPFFLLRGVRQRFGVCLGARLRAVSPAEVPPDQICHGDANGQDDGSAYCSSYHGCLRDGRLLSATSG